MNQNGQMAIFIALVFQVLFVFFAMTINIGLLVHDKINLQNSADLAAYYGAQRQAEILNAIAHSNYQIRQSWKLLSWRVRALGDSGRASHPWRPGDGKPPPNQERPLYLNTTSSVGKDVEDYPSVCTNHNYWVESYIGGPVASTAQNVCFKPSGLEIPEISSFNVIPGAAGFVGLTMVSSAIEQFKKSQQSFCKDYGITNWMIGATWLLQYKNDVAFKKRKIRELASLLAQDTRDFTDVRGQSARQGVEQTLYNNLTRTNRQGLENIEFFNSLGGMSPRAWLNEIPVRPFVYYSDFVKKPGSANTCNTQRKKVNFWEENPAKEVFPGITQEHQFWRDEVQKFLDVIVEPDESTSEIQSIVGVEKNPWLMSYVGVRVVSSPRKPFAPFGEPIRLVAKAYAKPFGGRVGPWMYNRWPVGGPSSFGTTDDLVDKLLPPALNVPVDGSKDQDRLVPNYSRFPGDQLGLRSQKALFATYNKPLLEGKVSYNVFNRNFDSNTQPNPLAGDPDGGGTVPLTSMELAAIAPDLFDITYYSIEPRYIDNYRELFNPEIGVGVADLHDPNLLQGRTPSIASQIQNAANLLDLNQAAWVVSNWRNLLTGWVPGGNQNFSSLNPSQFGKCAPGMEGTIPGGCQVGGRTGYSVKIVSKKYLNRKDLPLGGPDIEGPILNPPPDW